MVSFSDDRGTHGVRVGMTFSIMSVASVSGPPLAGKLIEVRGGDYLAAQLWGGTALLVGAAVLLAARWAKH